MEDGARLALLLLTGCLPLMAMRDRFRPGVFRLVVIAYAVFALAAGAALFMRERREVAPVPQDSEPQRETVLT